MPWYDGLRDALTHPVRSATSVFYGITSASSQLGSAVLGRINHFLPQGAKQQVDEFAEGWGSAFPTLPPEPKQESNLHRQGKSSAAVSATATDGKAAASQPKETLFDKSMSSFFTMNMIYGLEAISYQMLGSVLQQANRDGHISDATEQVATVVLHVYMLREFQRLLVLNSLFYLEHGMFVAELKQPVNVWACGCSDYIPPPQKAHNAPDEQQVDAEAEQRALEAQKKALKNRVIKPAIHGFAPQIALGVAQGLAGALPAVINATPFNAYTVTGAAVVGTTAGVALTSEASRTAIWGLVASQRENLATVPKQLVEFGRAIKDMSPGLLIVGLALSALYFDQLAQAIIAVGVGLAGAIPKLPTVNPQLPSLSFDYTNPMAYLDMVFIAAQAIIYGQTFISYYIQRAGQCKDHIDNLLSHHNAYAQGKGACLIAAVGSAQLALGCMGMSNFYSNDMAFSIIWGIFNVSNRVSPFLECDEGKGGKIEEKPTKYDFTRPIRLGSDWLVDALASRIEPHWDEIQKYFESEEKGMVLRKFIGDKFHSSLLIFIPTEILSLNALLASPPGQVLLVYAQEELRLAIIGIKAAQKVEQDKGWSNLLRAFLGGTGIYRLEVLLPKSIYEILEQMLRKRELNGHFTSRLSEQVENADVTPHKLLTIQYRDLCRAEDGAVAKAGDGNAAPNNGQSNVAPSQTTAAPATAGQSGQSAVTVDPNELEKYPKPY